MIGFLNPETIIGIFIFVFFWGGEIIFVVYLPMYEGGRPYTFFSSGVRTYPSTYFFS